jgi:hypothetical protein
MPVSPRICLPNVLSRVLEQLTLETDVGEFQGRLAEFLPLLEEEFDREEGVGGLHDEVRSLDPNATFALGRLVEEHADILARIGKLIEVSERVSARLAAMQASRSSLAWKIRDHRRLENRLLLEAYFRDIGGH